MTEKDKDESESKVDKDSYNLLVAKLNAHLDSIEFMKLDFKTSLISALIGGIIGSEIPVNYVSQIPIEPINFIKLIIIFILIFILVHGLKFICHKVAVRYLRRKINRIKNQSATY